MPSSTQLSGSTLYTTLREQHLAPRLLLREPADFLDPIPISERLVQAVWNDQLFDISRLRTTENQPLEILHPGRWNPEGGPDFSGAQIRLDGKILAGDIEIHLHSSGWNSHRHSSNPAYDRVILDVALWNDDAPLPKNKQGKAIPRLILTPFLTCSLMELTESIDPDRYPFTPISNRKRLKRLLHLSSREIFPCVESAGWFRLEQKSARIRELLARQSPDETAYQLLAEALGYKHNKWIFSQLARDLPLQLLSRIPSVDARINLFMDRVSYLPLRTSQVRPTNHPHRRLAALALLTSMEPRPSEWFLTLVKSRRMPPVPRLQHPFWSHHYHARSRAMPRPLALIGLERWRDIFINAIIPFSLASSPQNSSSTPTGDIHRLFQTIPLPQTNLAVRHMAHDLGLEGRINTLQQQGLIQMYQDFDLLMANQGDDGDRLPC